MIISWPVHPRSRQKAHPPQPPQKQFSSQHALVKKTGADRRHATRWTAELCPKMNGLCLGVIIWCVCVCFGQRVVILQRVPNNHPIPHPPYALHWGSFYRYHGGLALCPGSLFKGQTVMSNHNGLRTLYHQQQLLYTPLPFPSPKEYPPKSAIFFIQSQQSFN